MDKKIMARLNELERKINPRDSTVVTMFPGDEESRKIPFPDFIKRCRCDSVIYGFRFVGEGNDEQIDLLVDLIDDYCNDEL